MGDESLQHALFDAMSWVDRMAKTPGQRELRTRLDQYRRVLDSWVANPPSPEQQQALGEQIAEVRRLARDTAPTRRRRVKPEG